MNRISTLAMVVALVLTGCIQTRMQTRTVDLSDPYAKLDPYVKIHPQNASKRNVSITVINRQARRREALITLSDTRLVRARSLQVTPDSTSWFDAKTGLFERIATSEVEMIRFNKAREGFVRRFLVSATVGAAVGAAIGFAFGDDPECPGCQSFGCLYYSCTSYSAADKAAMGALAGATLGGAMGASLGRQKYLYRFEMISR